MCTLQYLLVSLLAVYHLVDHSEGILTTYDGGHFWTCLDVRDPDRRIIEALMDRYSILHNYTATKAIKSPTSIQYKYCHNIRMHVHT